MASFLNNSLGKWAGRDAANTCNVMVVRSQNCRRLPLIILSLRGLHEAEKSIKEGLVCSKPFFY